MKTKARTYIEITLWIGACVVTVGISLGAASSPDSVQEPPAGQNITATDRTAETKMRSANEQQGKVHQVDDASFSELVLNSDVAVLVAFYADWCGPCRILAPVLDELAAEMKAAKIVKINVDENPELAERYKIASIPSLKVFEDGEVVSEHAGLASKTELKRMLDI